MKTVRWCGGKQGATFWPTGPVWNLLAVLFFIAAQLAPVAHFLTTPHKLGFDHGSPVAVHCSGHDHEQDHDDSDADGEEPCQIYLCIFNSTAEFPFHSGVLLTDWEFRGVRLPESEKPERTARLYLLAPSHSPPVL